MNTNTVYDKIRGPYGDVFRRDAFSILVCGLQSTPAAAHLAAHQALSNPRQLTRRRPGHHFSGTSRVIIKGLLFGAAGRQSHAAHAADWQ